MQHLCPNCNSGLLNLCVGFECPGCGYTAQYRLITASYLGLDDLNDLRRENDFEPLTKLPAQNKAHIQTRRE